MTEDEFFACLDDCLRREEEDSTAAAAAAAAALEAAAAQSRREEAAAQTRREEAAAKSRRDRARARRAFFWALFLFVVQLPFTALVLFALSSAERVRCVVEVAAEAGATHWAAVAFSVVWAYAAFESMTNLVKSAVAYYFARRNVQS
jgi:ABC-type Fe3+ transport system permease subunit